MSRSNYDKPFYVDVGTSIVAVRCASNHDVILEYDRSRHPSVIELAETACDRMNKEVEIGRPRRNCDVGTAEERMYRYNRLRDEINEEYKRFGEIPPAFAFPTAFEWEDRPYEEGGAK